MTKKIQRLPSFAKLPLAVAVAATMSTPASAFQFYIGDMEASLDTTLTAGTSWRVEDQSNKLIGIGNGGTGGTINFDNGNANFEKGDVYSSLVKGVSDFLVSYEDYGMFVRAKYWYDFELKDNDQDYPLTSRGKANASGAEFLDAYIWGDYWLGDDTPLNLRLGYQVLSWGESTFIFNGINVINPLDIGAITAPGAEVKEALVPVNMLYGSLGLTEDITVEAFVQLEYEPSKLTDCGTYFSNIDYAADGCDVVYANSSISEETNEGLGAVVPRDADKLPRDTDQFGVAVRWFAADWNETEFGFYYMQYHNRFPNIGNKTAEDRNGNGTLELAEVIHPDTGSTFSLEYAEDITSMGVSFNTTGPGGVSLSGEYSFKQDVPVQLNSSDLGNRSGVVLDANGVPLSPIVHDRFDTSGDGFADATEYAASFGLDQTGYDRYDISQIQMTAIQFFDQVLGASRLSVAAEVGATYVHDLPDAKDLGIRYGRFDMAGLGLLAGTTDLTGLERCEAASNVAGSCDLDGYTTDFSWGYRARASLSYADVFAGVNLTPTLSWSHDVQGYAPSPGGNFTEGRMSAGASLRADYLNAYSANLSYNRFMGAESGLNPFKDRDNVSLSVSYSF